MAHLRFPYLQIGIKNGMEYNLNNTFQTKRFKTKKQNRHDFSKSKQQRLWKNI